MKGYTLEDEALTSQQNSGSIYLFLKLIIKSFQKLCHVQLDLDIFFVNLIAQIGYCI